MNTNQTARKKTVRRNFSAQTLVIGILLGFMAGLLIGLRLAGTTPADAPAAAADVQVKDDAQRYEVSADDDPFLGPVDAPVTIIEFSDYQCPFCKKWHDEVLSRLLDTYGDQIRFVYRDFPLSGLHPFATAAAEAANCAGEQDAYWAYHDALFSDQYPFSDSGLRQYAQDLNLDINAFDECVQTRRYQDEVSADYQAAAALGVNSTPTFFINGLAVIGAQPIEVFVQIIDQELERISQDQ